MDFDLSDDQLALRDGATRAPRRLCVTCARARPTPRRATRSTRALWDAMVEQGWLGIEVPEAEGGIGLGAVEVAVLAEELGAHAAPAPFVPAVLALDALARCRRDRRGSSACSAATRARASRGISAHPVPYAPSADLAVVCDDDGVFAVELADRAAARAGDGPHPRARLARRRRPRPRSPLGRRRRARTAARPRRDLHASADMLGGAAARARHGGRVREGPRAVRPPDRVVPGGEAPLRRHARRRRGHALDRVLGRVVHRRRRSRRVDRGVDREDLVLGRVEARRWPRRCRCTAASASRGSTTCTSS